ncbi:hypothetical protein OG581_48470 [Streptomyces sp. NBC_01386]|uniref:hypothetical protein n=1 Tax=Streptomyces sp. NBC_01386 TaxID=2903848 RepID=UPI0032462764
MLTDLGRTVRLAHAVDEKKGHGFIDSQRAGIEVFKQLPPDAPLIVVEGANNCCGMHSRISTNVFFSLTLGGARPVRHPGLLPPMGGFVRSS